MVHTATQIEHGKITTIEDARNDEALRDRFDISARVLDKLSQRLGGDASFIPACVPAGETLEMHLANAYFLCERLGCATVVVGHSKESNVTVLQRPAL